MEDILLDYLSVLCISQWSARGGRGEHVHNGQSQRGVGQSKGTPEIKSLMKGEGSTVWLLIQDAMYSGNGKLVHQHMLYTTHVYTMYVHVRVHVRVPCTWCATLYMKSTEETGQSFFQCRVTMPTLSPHNGHRRTCTMAYTWRWCAMYMHWYIGSCTCTMYMYMHWYIGTCTCTMYMH
jgi:hypothetical protein